MKNADKFIKCYDQMVEERFEKFGEYYPFRTWDEFYADQDETFEKYFKNKPLSEKTISLYMKIFADALEPFGMYLTFQKQDCKILNNVLYQTARRMLLNSGMTASGTDHCNVYDGIIHAFACNDFAVFERFFPKYLPFTKYPFYISPAMNLIKVMYYQEDEHKELVLLQAEKFLKKKSAILDKAVINYLVALMLRDAVVASEALEQACKGWQSSKLLDGLGKCFAHEIHGLYHFARYIDKAFFEAIVAPSHPCFSAEFEFWQNQHDYPIGQIFYKYPSEMEHVNQIFTVDIPELGLIEYKKNHYYKDVDKFKKDLTNTVIALNQ